MQKQGKGAFEAPGEWQPGITNGSERYLPLASQYNAAMHLGHMASYREALKYAYGKKTLDIGCGVGYGAFFLAYHGAKHVTAFDLGLNALSYAREIYHHPRLDYLQADGMALPFKDRTFDFVFSSQVIEHIPSVETFLQEIRRVLKPDGFCLITTPNENLFSPGHEAANPYHVSEMDLETYQSRMQNAFPKILLKGIPQHCLRWSEANKIMGLKPNWDILPENYRAREYSLGECENMLCFGHNAENGSFNSDLPASLAPVVEELSPMFWDAEHTEWAVMRNYPASAPTQPVPFLFGRLGQEFTAPADGLYRLQVDFEKACPAPLKAFLYDVENGKRRIAEAQVLPGQKLFDLVFPVQSKSSARKYLLEFVRPKKMGDLFRQAEAVYFGANLPSQSLPAFRINGVEQKACLSTRVFYALPPLEQA